MSWVESCRHCATGDRLDPSVVDDDLGVNQMKLCFNPHSPCLDAATVNGVGDAFITTIATDDVVDYGLDCCCSDTVTNAATADSHQFTSCHTALAGSPSMDSAATDHIQSVTVRNLPVVVSSYQLQQRCLSHHSLEPGAGRRRTKAPPHTLFGLQPVPGLELDFVGQASQQLHSSVGLVARSKGQEGVIGWCLLHHSSSLMDQAIVSLVVDSSYYSRVFN